MTELTRTKTRPDTRWGAPLVGGLVALAIALGICAGLVAWGHRTFPDNKDGAAQRFRQVLPVPQGAAAAVLGFQRVAVTLDRREVATADPDSRSPERLTYRMVVPPLGGLLLVGLALVIGGAVTRRLETQEAGSIARMAVVFAVACFALSFLISLGKATVPRDPNIALGFTVTYRPSHIGAVIWPLVWGLAFGSLGAFIATHGRRWRRELLEARGPAFRAALSGLVTGIALVLLAGVLTAVVGIATHKDQAGDVLGSAKNVAGIAEGIVLGLPHATGGSLLLSMGIPARYTLDVYDSDYFDESATASIFGGERDRPGLAHGFGVPAPPRERYELAIPRYALGGLLIAMAFTVVAGYRAAAGSAGSVARALRSAAVAAAWMTVFLWIIAYLVDVESDVRVFQGSTVSGADATLGPSFVPVLFLPLVWALGGGMLGALLRVRQERA